MDYRVPIIGVCDGNICFIAHQLSYHGHRDAVKFFVTVRCGDHDLRKLPLRDSDAVSTSHRPEAPPKSTYLIMSGGEGYKDFRLSMTALCYHCHANGVSVVPAENVLKLNSKYMNSKLETKSDDLTKNNSHLIAWQLSL